MFGRAEGARAELSRANSSEKKKKYIYIYIYISLKMSAMLLSNSEKQSMNDVRRREGCLAATGWNDGTTDWCQPFAGEKFAYIGKVLRSVPDPISTAMFINIHWMEMSLQNLFPFFQKSFLWKIALKKLHVLWPR